MTDKQSAGGAAASSGEGFQSRVAAWFSVKILAEQATSLPFGLSRVTLESIYCQTGLPVDDILLETSDGGRLYLQVKARLSLSREPTSDLASALDQFTRQLVACERVEERLHGWDRPLDPLKDRLVLLAGPNSSAPVRVHVASVLDRLRMQDQLPIGDAAKNKAEQVALSIVLQHLNRSWHTVLSETPTEDDLRRIMSLIHIYTLDVGSGGKDETTALQFLRTAILKDPTQSESAWSHLISWCANLAATRSGASRRNLQKSLLDARIDLVAVRSYWDSIERLKQYSRTTLNSVSRLTRIRAGTDEVKLNRAANHELRRLAEEISLLVIGEPGAGKSVVLHDLTQILTEEHRDVVFLSVDRLPVVSLGSLRSELGLHDGLVEVLKNWLGIEVGFLIIDGLDAARGSGASHVFHELIRDLSEIAERWRVIASVRQYDLRCSPTLQQLFKGTASTTFRDSDFPDVKHLKVPLLSDDELSQVKSQSPVLSEVIEHAPEGLLRLIRVPFNLRLIGDLISCGVAAADLARSQSQLDLLERYWKERISRGDKQDDVREAVLRAVCEKMVKRRELRTDRPLHQNTGGAAALDDLLSAEVLTEWRPAATSPPERYVLGFSHNILFDYAVARLLLRGTPSELIERLEREPDLTIAIRPSLKMHFQHLWGFGGNRETYWESVFGILANDSIPEIGKLIGPVVAAESARNLSDLEPMCAALEDAAPLKRGAAEQALRHIVGSILALPSGDVALMSPRAGLWCEFVERVTRNLRSPIAYAVRPLISAISEHADSLLSERRSALGTAARRLLEFAWSLDSYDQMLVISALQAVCRTVSSNVAESVCLLRCCLTPEHLGEHGHEEMPWIAREADWLILQAPEFVEELYTRAFAYEEQSGDPTALGSSRILPLTSNRRQDYEMALFALAQKFGNFLSNAPLHATRALIDVMDSYVERRHNLQRSAEEEESFDFRGRQARYQTDYSEIWDNGSTYRNDEPLKMLGAFEQFLERLAQNDAPTELREVIGTMIERCVLAVFWRRLLLLGARYPDSIGREIRPLVWASPILLGRDTRRAAGEFLKVIFPQLDESDRRTIEQLIQSLPNSVSENHYAETTIISNRLLGCLNRNGLVTDEAKRLLCELRTTDAIPPDESVSLQLGFVPMAFGEEEQLADQGVQVDAEPNVEIRKLEQPVSEFVSRHSNTPPDQQEVAFILPALQKLHTALADADASGVHPRQRDYALGYLVAACASIAASDELTISETASDFVREVLLESSRHPEPVYDPEEAIHFDEHPTWGGNQPRTEAAAGLTSLGKHGSYITDDVLEAITRLSTDSAPEVRFQIARRLTNYHETKRDFMWDRVEHFSRYEESRGVLQFLVACTLMPLGRVDPSRVANLALAILDRIQEGPGAQKVRGSCVSLLTALHVWRNVPAAENLLVQMTSNPAKWADELGSVLSELRAALTFGPTDHLEPQAEETRARAFDLLMRIATSSSDSLSLLEAKYAGKQLSDLAAEDREVARILARLADHIGNEIYFASGAYARAEGTSRDETKQISVEQMHRFYRESSRVLELLADLGFPSLAHRLLETLETLIGFDPKGVFLLIGRVLKGGQRGGYQYESLAVNLLVKLFERYLTEYRSLLQKDADCRNALIESLDIFVRAGWPSARRLTGRLEEIFR